MNLQGRDLKLSLSGDDVRLLHRELEQIGFTISEIERQQVMFGQTTHDAVLRFQEDYELRQTGMVDREAASAIGRATEDSRYTVSDTVTGPDRAGVGGLRVQVVDKNVEANALLTEGTTDHDGHYTAYFTAHSLRKRHKQQPDLQARVYAGQTFLAASKIRYNTSKKETLDVALPANATGLPSEYTTLSMLKTHYGGRLRDLQEIADRQDKRGYYQSAKWELLLYGTIPVQIPRSTLDEQRTNDAEMLAVQVRTAFPTAVVFGF